MKYKKDINSILWLYFLGKLSICIMEKAEIFHIQKKKKNILQFQNFKSWENFVCGVQKVDTFYRLKG